MGTKAPVELEDTEARGVSWAESTPVVVWTADPDGSLDYVSHALAEYMGKPVEDAFGTSWHSIVHPDDLSRTIGLWTHAVQTGEEYETEHRVRRADGVYRWFHVRAKPMRNEDGTITKWFGTSADIQDFKVLRETLEEERTRLKAERGADHVLLEAMVRQMPHGVAIVEVPSGKMVLANRHVEEVVGHPLGPGGPLIEDFARATFDKNGQPWPPGHHPLARTLKFGESMRDCELSYRRPDGSLGILSFDASLVASGSRSVSAMIMTFQDITERKRTEERLELLADARALLASSLDYAPTLSSLISVVVPRFADWCAINLLNDDGLLDRAATAHADVGAVLEPEESPPPYSVRAEKDFGASRVVRTGRPEFGLVNEHVLAAMPRDVERLHRTHGMRFTAYIAVPLAARGRVLGVATFLTAEARRLYDERDVATAMELGRRAALALDNAALFESSLRERQRVEEANRAKDEFLATISHELRTPLNAILGWADMLRVEDFDDEQRRRSIETIYRNAKAQAQLIEELLDISRITTGKLRLNVRPIDLIEVLQAAMNATRPAADAKEITIQTDFERGLRTIAGDSDRLQQVMWNLLSNAIKFSFRKGVIKLSVRHVDGSIEVVVTDQGQGIRSDFLPYVFERFRQADSRITRAHGGLGLGLAIVRHLVELHGGTIVASSAGLDKGTTITLALPTSLRKLEAATPSPPPVMVQPFGLEGAPRFDGITMLVVDDEADARDLLVTVLTRCHADVIVSDSARDAFEQLQRCRPDVLITDIGMPDEDGYALLRRVRALSPDKGGKIPAVALTAYARLEDRTRALLEGFQLHLAKPIEPSHLLAALASLRLQPSP